MNPYEAKEFGLIDKILEQVPKPGSDDTEASPVQEKNDWYTCLKMTSTSNSVCKDIGNAF